MYCHADAFEQARWFGNDVALKHGVYEPSQAVGAALTEGLTSLVASDGAFRITDEYR